MRLTRIDESHWADHVHLAPTDVCFFLREYTSGQGFGFSDTNQLLSNLKKSPLGSANPGYHYKSKAIRQCSDELKAALNPKWLECATLVPVPPSKVRTDPGHDDRIARICRGMGEALDVRELVCQAGSTRASHVSGSNRVTVRELLDVYVLDEQLADPLPASIAVVDDMLTAGTHFRAMHSVLCARFPGIQVIGLFIARRVFAGPDTGQSGIVPIRP
ncbi:hypothetical protein [Hyphomonas sp.]|uniref:hypothetical protein n=1 Tax=Hyphomonas sp. TaxID=87 RepID=UPI003919A411